MVLGAGRGEARGNGTCADPGCGKKRGQVRSYSHYRSCVNGPRGLARRPAGLPWPPLGPVLGQTHALLDTVQASLSSLVGWFADVGNLQGNTQ